MDIAYLFPVMTLEVQNSTTNFSMILEATKTPITHILKFSWQQISIKS